MPDAPPPLRLLEPRLALGDRWRLPAALGVSLAVALLVASMVHHNRAELRCEDGRLVAYRGHARGFGRDPLDVERFPPIEVTPAACRTRTFGSIEELAREHAELRTTERPTDDVEPVEPTEPLEPAESEAPVDAADGPIAGVLLEASVQADLQQARALLERARARLRSARSTEIDVELIDHLEAAVERIGGCEALPAPDEAAEADETDSSAIAL